MLRPASDPVLLNKMKHLNAKYTACLICLANQESIWDNPKGNVPITVNTI